MNNNQISNPKVEVSTGIKMNDKDHLSNLLSCLKAMEKDYTVAMTEASNETLYGKIKTMFNNISTLQREVFETSFRFGWYKLEKAEQTKIQTKHQMLLQEYNELN